VSSGIEKYIHLSRETEGKSSQVTLAATKLGYRARSICQWRFYW